MFASISTGASCERRKNKGRNQHIPAGLSLRPTKNSEQFELVELVGAFLSLLTFLIFPISVGPNCPRNKKRESFDQNQQIDFKLNGIVWPLDASAERQVINSPSIKGRELSTCFVTPT